MGVDKPGREFRAAAVLLDELEAVGAWLALLVDVSHAAQQRVEDYLGVILKEVDLKQRNICMCKIE